MSEGSPRKLHISLDPVEEQCFSTWLRLLNEIDVPYAVGGAFAVGAYTSVFRDTKDLDVFLRPRDLRKILEATSTGGFRVEVTDVYWLAKVHAPPFFMDIIFGLQNNCIRITRDWFRSAVPVEILGVPTHVLGIEELIASKMYVARRDRFDGSDIVHLIKAKKGRIDWDRLLEILGEDSTLLLWHLILFDFVYPGYSSYLPQPLMHELFERIRNRWQKDVSTKLCYGTVLDPLQFDGDCEKDPRPLGMPPVDEQGDPL
ncbi:MAG: DUF6036 family nucleotidyltransferase [Desulfovibrionales bacterium]